MKEQEKMYRTFTDGWAMRGERISVNGWKCTETGREAMFIASVLLRLVRILNRRRLE